MSDPSHWAVLARGWQRIGPPLRPDPSVIEQVRIALAEHYRAAPGAPRALLFGVTPELATLDLPVAMELLAFDQSPAMVSVVWPGDTAHRRAQVGDWFALDVADASITIAMGDGCFTPLEYPTGYQQLAATLGRVLHQDGLFSIRLFCRPEPAESVESVFDDLLAARIGNFHAFKWRLAAALQGDDTASGVGLGAIWCSFRDRAGGAPALAESLGWPLEEVLTIDNYRGSASRYTFSSVAEVVAELAPDFELLREWRGTYELAERCPLLLFRRR